MNIPRLQVVQPQSHSLGKGQPGQFIDSLTGNAYDEIKVVPLRLQRGRRYFPKGADRPVCFSSDAIAPHGNVAEAISKDCTICELAEWGADRTPPECRDQYSLFGLRIEELDGVEYSFPFVMNIKGSSIKAVKNFRTYGEAFNLQPYQIVVVMKTFERIDQAGRWFVLDMRMAAADPVNKYADRAAEMMTRREGRTAVDGAAGDDIPF